MDKILVGVDGGATNCRVAICNENGHRIAEAHGGPSNIANQYDSAQATIVQTILDALQSIGKSRDDFDKVYAVLGVAGNNLGDFGQRLEDDLPFAKSHVVNDGYITAKGALQNDDGAMAVLGTGSVFVSQVNQNIRSVGGWGFLLGDEGSGGKLGFHLFERTIYAEDGLFEHSPLTQAVIAEFNGKIGYLVEAAKAMRPHEFGEYAPRIIDAARNGDANAVQIMNDAVKWIEAQVNAVGFKDGMNFCVLGGLGPIFLPMLDEKFRAAYVTPKGNALDGALLMARQLYL